MYVKLWSRLNISEYNTLNLIIEHYTLRNTSVSLTFKFSSVCLYVKNFDLATNCTENSTLSQSKRV